MKNKPSREYLIINKKLHESDFQEACFANDGDSGSFILNENGELTGILFRGIKRQWAFGGVAMSMADVLVSMKLKLGASVSLSWTFSLFLIFTIASIVSLLSAFCLFCSEHG